MQEDIEECVRKRKRDSSNLRQYLRPSALEQDQFYRVWSRQLNDFSADSRTFAADMDEMNARLRALFDKVAEKKTTDFPPQDINGERLEFLGLSGGHSPDKPRKRSKRYASSMWLYSILLAGDVQRT